MKSFCCHSFSTPIYIFKHLEDQLHSLQQSRCVHLHCPGVQLQGTSSTASSFFNSIAFSNLSISLKLNVAFEIKCTIVFPTSRLQIFPNVSCKFILRNFSSVIVGELINLFPSFSVSRIPFLTNLPINVFVVAGFHSIFCSNTSLISLLVTRSLAQTTRITSHSELEIWISMSFIIITSTFVYICNLFDLI